MSKWIHAAGAVSWLFWIWLAVLSSLGVERLLWWMLGVQGLTWIVLFSVLACKGCVPTLGIWGWAVLFRITGFFAIPVLEDDYFRYLWDGRMFALTGNPYAEPPLVFFSNPDVPDSFRLILDQINHPDVPSIYGPVCQLAFAASYWLGPGQLWPWKLILLVADLLTLGILRRLTPDWRPALFYAWCPLLILETGFNAHPDSLAIGFLIAAIAARTQWIRARETGVSNHPRLARAAGLLCALAVGAKVFALLLVPFVLCALPRKAWLSFVATLGLIYAPFLLQHGAAEWPGLLIMAAQWEFNSSLFALAQRVMPAQTARIYCAAAFAVVWMALGWRWTHYREIQPCLDSTRYPKSESQHVGQTRALGDFGWCLPVRAAAGQETRAPAAPPSRSLGSTQLLFHYGGIVLGSFFLFSTTVNPWYLLWLLPCVVMAPSLTGIVALVVVSLSYVTGLNCGDPQITNFGHPGWVRPLEFGAIGLALMADWRLRNRQSST